MEKKIGDAHEACKLFLSHGVEWIGSQNLESELAQLALGLQEHGGFKVALLALFERSYSLPTALLISIGFFLFRFFL